MIHFQLPQIEAMLQGKYRMTFYRSQAESFYREQLSALRPARYAVQRKWQVKEFPAVSLRQRWFERLIRQDEIGFCNIFFDRMEQEKDEEHRVYLVYIAQQMLIRLMKDLQQTALSLLKDHESMQDVTQAALHRIQQEEQQILRLLKAALVALYLDVQAFADNGKAKLPTVDEDGLYAYYFLENAGSGGLITTASVIVQPIKPVQQQKQFIPLRGDRDHVASLKLTYNDILKQEEFQALEELLFEYGLLNEHSIFIKNKKESHNKLMAAIYHQIIRLGFFRKRSLSTKTEITIYDVRNYLNQRYGIDLKQEFRKSTQEDRELAIRKLPFLEMDARFRVKGEQ